MVLLIGPSVLQLFEMRCQEKRGLGKRCARCVAALFPLKISTFSSSSSSFFFSWRFPYLQLLHCFYSILIINKCLEEHAIFFASGAFKTLKDSAR